MSLFSVAVYVIVRVGKKATPFIFATVVTSLWVFLVLFNCVLFIPGVMIIEWTDGVSCSPRQKGSGTYIFLSIDVVICGLVPFTLTIVMPPLTLSYIKRNLITEDVILKKTLVKFALFLIVGNVLGIIGLLVPVLIAVFAPDDANHDVDVALVRTAGLYLYHNLPILQIHNNISHQIGRTDTDTDIHSWLYQLIGHHKFIVVIIAFHIWASLCTCMTAVAFVETGV